LEVESWNELLVEIVKISRAHCMYLTAKVFSEAVQRLKSSHPVLTTLSHLFTLYWIEQEIGDFTADGYLNAAQTTFLRKAIRQLLDEVRPNAVGLVDAFDFSDQVLQSAIGKYDGKVYEKLLQWVQREPLNTQNVSKLYTDYLRPILQPPKSKM